VPAFKLFIIIRMKDHSKEHLYTASLHTGVCQ
jgi:hypothetical protein